MRLLILFYLRQLLLIIFLLLGNTFAANFDERKIDLLTDSTTIYERLIAEEKNEISPVGGSLALGFGGGLTFIGGIAFYNAITFKSKEGFNGAAIIAPLAVIGIPLMIYGIYDIFASKAHTRKLEQLEQQYDRYKKRKQTAQIFIAPLIGVLYPQAGIGMHVSF